MNNTMRRKFNEEGSMFRRLIASAALVAGASVLTFAATERATFILTDGERKSGPVVFHGGDHENLINGHLNLGVDNGLDLTFPVEQVAVIDFVGGQPPTTELAQLGTRHMLVLRDGATQQGRFINMTGGDTLFWENLGGQRQQYAIRDVTRVYLNPQSARVTFGYTAPPAAKSPAPGAATAAPSETTGTAPPAITVRVDPRQPWTDTGLAVNQGDRVAFQASGQGPGRYGRQATSQDPNSQRRRRSDTDPPTPVGGLVGRIGNSAPFAIALQRPLAMPASGRLMLGVDGNDLIDTNGFVTVVVTR
jgi:hypothetical protein